MNKTNLCTKKFKISTFFEKKWQLWAKKYVNSGNKFQTKNKFHAKKNPFEYSPPRI